MLILRELLEINKDDLLCEDFGNLKGIDKNLLRALMSQEYVGANGPGQYKYRDVLAKAAGQASTTSDVEIKNSKTVTNEFENNPKTIGAVIYDKVSGKQFAMIGIKVEKTYKSERKMGIVVNYVAISGDNPRPEDIKHHRSLVWDELKAMTEKPKNYLSVERDYKDSQAAKAVNLIRNRAALWKSNGKDVKLYVKFIYTDEERPKARSERAQRKSGIIPVKLSPKDAEQFKTNALQSLKQRLDVYKSEKLKNSGNKISIDDFAKAIRNEGFLDKFNVDGHIYNYYDDRINFSAMKKGLHKPNANGYTDESYITYRVDDSTPSYQEMQNKYWEGRSELASNFKDDPEAYQREHIKLKRRLKVPPSRIQVLLDFEGGAIVPYDVKLDFSSI